MINQHNMTFLDDYFIDRYIFFLDDEFIFSINVYAKFIKTEKIGKFEIKFKYTLGVKKENKKYEKEINVS